MPNAANGLLSRAPATQKVGELLAPRVPVARPASMIAGSRRLAHVRAARPRQHIASSSLAAARSIHDIRREAAAHCYACRAGQSRTYASSTFQAEDEPAQSSSSTNTTTKAQGPLTDLAVLGSGITGLATALAAAKSIPNSKITIYEKSDRLGGWMSSTKVDVGDGEVIFEAGPRSLRPAPPNGELSLRLIESLDMMDELLITPRSSPAAKNRFIYYPDHLVHMPGPGQRMFDILRTVWSEPAFDGSIRGLFNSVTRNVAMEDVADESVGAYVSRRFGEGVANNLVSALFHGIYAGDIWQLSAKEILAQPWAQERKFGSFSGTLLATMQQKTNWRFCDDVELLMKVQQDGWDPAVRARLQDCSVFTFKEGLQALADGIATKLRSMPNVTIKTGANITAMSVPDSTGKITITTTPPAADSSTAISSATHTHIISTLAAPVTSSLIRASITTPPKPSSPSVPQSLSVRDAAGLDALAATRATTVAVVNFYFRTPHLLQSSACRPPGGLPASLGPSGLQGFGYLIPRSVPYEQNPERALGVIFDSDISPDLWTSVAPDRLGTRLTVMLGGHWWDGWDAFPSQSEAVELARSVLERHLGITEEPVVARATVQESCIPQYTVGHGARMGRAHDALQSLYNGRLKVAGSWYSGVGVNDCVRAAHEIVEGMARPDARERTGLEKFAWGRPMVLVRRADGGVLEVLKVDKLAQRQGYFKGVRVEEDEAN